MDEWGSFNGTAEIPCVTVFGTELRKGGRVRLWPQRRADILDSALTGQAAIIEAIEMTMEGETFLAVLLEADPGHDLGELRQIGHRFFFRLDEIEPLNEKTAPVVMDASSVVEASPLMEER